MAQSAQEKYLKKQKQITTAKNNLQVKSVLLNRKQINTPNKKAVSLEIC